MVRRGGTNNFNGDESFSYIMPNPGEGTFQAGGGFQPEHGRSVLAGRKRTPAGS